MRHYGWIFIVVLIWGSATLPAGARESWAPERVPMMAKATWWHHLSDTVRRLVARANGDILSPPKPQPVSGEVPPPRPERTMTVERAGGTVP